MDGSLPTIRLDIATPSEINLASTVLDQDQQVLLLTAANNGCGVTTSAITMVQQLAAACSGKVLLIDASLSSNSITCQLGLQQQPGFLDLGAGNDLTSLDACLVELPSYPFHLLPLGKRRNDGNGLSAESLRQLLAQLSERYRFVVIDGEAVYTGGDTLTIGSLVDGVILVVRAEETRWEVAQAAAQRLAQAGAKLLGSVLNARKYYMPKWVYDQL
ncbi:cobalamin biosynthesis protein CobQ [Stutzerimonas stutzeri]|uniref:Cobalamin biosynthesis protein CobQ n=1 Tax=Stutzerimonas stutzeri TaxID=316 RepID=W8RFR7_STUST|nr:cobalamin biosynthesis protein CobQ [Stutzerimonas stutzeri]AHL77377.1 cobalamin biosynthesis protein CobQ [Stutzerimonas stutzeri]MCQ4330272.1 cobalamin biosynthesis protein CobQ [Stutzerimonas stutzeri]